MKRNLLAISRRVINFKNVVLCCASLSLIMKLVKRLHLLDGYGYAKVHFKFRTGTIDVPRLGVYQEAIPPPSQKHFCQAHPFFPLDTKEN